MIQKISWEQILDIWKNRLWPNRVSPIEPNSAMVFLGGYDMINMSTTPTFFGFIVNDELVGVNSGHMCNNKHYRSRGLFVDPKHRGNKYGSMLLSATIKQGISEGAELVWSLPRKTSFHSYEKAGFKLASDWFPTETSELNAYVVAQKSLTVKDF